MSARPRYVWRCSCGAEGEPSGRLDAERGAARHEQAQIFDALDHTAEAHRVVAVTCDEHPELASLDDVVAEVLGVASPEADACDDCGEPGKGTLRNGICSACRWEARHLQAGLRGGQ